MRGISVSLTQDGNALADPPGFCSSDLQLWLDYRISQNKQAGTNSIQATALIHWELFLYMLKPLGRYCTLVLIILNLHAHRADCGF